MSLKILDNGNIELTETVIKVINYEAIKKEKAFLEKRLAEINDILSQYDTEKSKTIVESVK